MTELYKDEALLNTVVQKKLPIMMTIDDLKGLDAGDKHLLAELGITGDKAVTRFGMAELTFRKLLTAANALNDNWANRVGSIEKGKFGDVIAVAGNPLTDVAEMERVKFVMRGGVVVKNDLPGPRTSSTGQ